MTYDFSNNSKTLSTTWLSWKRSRGVRNGMPKPPTYQTDYINDTGEMGARMLKRRHKKMFIDNEVNVKSLTNSDFMRLNSFIYLRLTSWTLNLIRRNKNAAHQIEEKPICANSICLSSQTFFMTLNVGECSELFQRRKISRSFFLLLRTRSALCKTRQEIRMLAAIGEFFAEVEFQMNWRMRSSSSEDCKALIDILMNVSWRFSLGSTVLRGLCF